MRNIKLTMAALLTLAVGGSPFSASAETWTLSQCVDYAIAHNIDIRRIALQADEGELAVVEAKDAFLPQLDASASQSFSFGRGLTAENVYANRNTASTQWGVNFSLPLFQGMREYRRLRVAELSLQQTLLECGSARDNVTLNVMSQYLQVLYCKEVAASARSQAEYSAFEVERQRALVEAGKVAEATLYDVEALAAQDRLQVVTADNDIRIALVNLANMLQLPSAEGFDVAPFDEATPPLPDAESVFTSAEAVNHSLLSAAQGLKVAEGNISLAKAGFIPTLSFSGGLGSSYYKLSGVPNAGFGTQMRNNYSTYIGFSLRIPLFDAFSTRNQVRRAKVQRLNAELQYEQRRSDLHKEIELAYCQAKGARERLLTSRETLEKSRLSFTATQERFNLGRATIADFEQAKNNLFRTEVTGIQALYEYLLRVKVLRFYQSNAL